MSSSTSIVEPISNFAPQEPAKPWIEPNDLDLIWMGIDLKRYNEEMDYFIRTLKGVVDQRVRDFADLPETPELKLMRRAATELHEALITDVQDPVTLYFMAAKLLSRICGYYQDLLGSKGKKAIPKMDGLVELEHPEGVTQLRAMVILRALKARPKLALHTEDCRKLLEGAEGRPLDYKVVRRAMKVLVDLYPAKIAGELFDGSYRVRIVS